MKNLRAIVLTALLAASARGDDWSQAGGDAARTRVPAESIASPALLGSLATGSPTFASPVASDGYLVTAGLDGVVRGYRESDRALLWTRSTGTSFVSTPVVDRGRVFLPALDGDLRVLRLETGALLGTVATGGSDYSSPALAGNLLYLAEGTTLTAIDITLLTVAWTATLDQVSYVSPAVAGGRVVVGTNNGTVAAFDATTGAPQWSTSIGGSLGSTAPLIFGSSVFVMSEATLTQLDLGTGAPVGSPLTLTDTPPANSLSVQYACSAPALVGGLLMGVVRFDYAIDNNFDGYVDVWTLREFAYAVDPSTMTPAWTPVPLGQLANVDLNSIPPYTIAPSAVSIGSDAAVASSLSATLRLVSSSGSVGASFALDAGCLASPFVANARLYAMTRAGTLYAYEGTDVQPAMATGLTPGGVELPTGPANLTWSGAGATYLVRMAKDGEFLMNWDFETTVSAGTVACPALATANGYTWGVRVRSVTGAWSPWTTAYFGVGMPAQPPGSLSATPRHQKVLLSWTPSPTPGVTGYRLSYGASTVDYGAVTTATVTGLTNGVSYTFNLSALDALGFPSASISATATPVSQIAVGGGHFDSIAAALAAALPGQTVQLGADTFEVGATLVVPTGVGLAGANARDTRLVATAPVVMVDAGQNASVRGLALSGGSVGVISAASGVTIANTVIRDMADAGVDISGTALVVNNTILQNANAGIRSTGHVDARNNISQGNGVGFQGAVVSTYNVENDGYLTAAPGVGDVHGTVLFLDPASGDYREQANQPSLDAGAPGDAYALEPPLNGGRINMGAFGNTPLAATSLTAGPKTKPGSSGACGLLGLEAVLVLAFLRRRR